MTSVSRRAPSIGQRLAGRIGDDAACDDLGRADELAVLLPHRDDRQDDAVFRKMPAIAQHLVGDLADARVVDQHAPGWRLADDVGAFGVELQDVAVLDQPHVHRTLEPRVTRSAMRRCSRQVADTRRAPARSTADAPASGRA